MFYSVPALSARCNRQCSYCTFIHCVFKTAGKREKSMNTDKTAFKKNHELSYAGLLSCKYGTFLLCKNNTSCYFFSKCLPWHFLTLQFEPKAEEKKKVILSALCSFQKGNQGIIKGEFLAKSQATAWNLSNYFPIKAWGLISHHWDQDIVLSPRCSFNLIDKMRAACKRLAAKGHTARGCLPFNISHSIKPISRLDFPAHPYHWLLIYPTACRTVSNDPSALQTFVFFKCQQYTGFKSLDD